jgi:hypothetical protein
MGINKAPSSVSFIAVSVGQDARELGPARSRLAACNAIRATRSITGPDHRSTPPSDHLFAELHDLAGSRCEVGLLCCKRAEANWERRCIIICRSPTATSAWLIVPSGQNHRHVPQNPLNPAVRNAMYPGASRIRRTDYSSGMWAGSPTPLPSPNLLHRTCQARRSREPGSQIVDPNLASETTSRPRERMPPSCRPPAKAAAVGMSPDSATAR